MLALVVAVARVGALVIGAGVGVLTPVAGVVATVLEVGVGAGALAPVVGVAEAGGAVLTWISSNPHRSNPVSSTTLDTDSVGLLQELPPPRFSGTFSNHGPQPTKGAGTIVPSAGVALMTVFPKCARSHHIHNMFL